MGSWIVENVVSGGVGDVRASIVLPPDEGLRPEQSLYGEEEAVFEHFAIDGAGDVAVDDERTNESPATDGTIDVEG